MSLISRIVNVFRSGRVDDDLDDELRFHLEETTQRLMDDGLPPTRPRARRDAGLAMALATRERSRDVKLLPWLDAMVRDVRFGVRMLRKDAWSRAPPSCRWRSRWARASRRSRSSMR